MAPPEPPYAQEPEVSFTPRSPEPSSSPPAVAVPLAPEMPKGDGIASAGGGGILSRTPELSDLDLPGSIGVTNDPSRETELGAGKWTESGRSLEELQKSLPTTPIRELRLDGAGLPWGRIVFGAALLFLVLAAIIRSGDDGETVVPPTPTEPATSSLPTRAEAAADGPEVTVTSDPERALISLDSTSYGRAPARVPVPSDDEVHELCAVADQVHVCRTLTAEQLLETDPLHLDLTGP